MIVVIVSPVLRHLHCSTLSSIIYIAFELINNA